MEGIREIELGRILPSKFSLRSPSEPVIHELMTSIKANGLLHPITVIPIDDTFFRLVAGLHRLEAVKRLGIKTVPAMVKDISDEEGFLMNVSENLLRNIHINPIAEARGYRDLISKNWTIHEIAIRIGKSDSYICNRIRLLDRLHVDIQKEFELPRGNSWLSVSHAEHLASLGDPQRQLELAALMKRRKLSVRQLERLTKNGWSRMPQEGCLCPKCPYYPDKCTRFSVVAIRPCCTTR